MKGIITRTITKAECPWLDSDVVAGEKVHKFIGTTYGVVGDGVPVSRVGAMDYPFFEIPQDAVEWFDER